MDKPVRSEEDRGLPMSATIVVGGLALFGAITLASWLIGAVFAIMRVVIAVAVIVGLIAWLVGRRTDR
ncbi:MAG: hypothetical protein ACXIVQ_16800 [Acidimicrobiales bacterium]